MKRTLCLFGLLGLLAFGMTGCRQVEDFVNDFRYTNPRQTGCTYTVYQNNLKFEHLKCVYWSTEDDDAIFKDFSGKQYYINGSSIIVEE